MHLFFSHIRFYLYLSLFTPFLHLVLSCSHCSMLTAISSVSVSRRAGHFVGAHSYCSSNNCNNWRALLSSMKSRTVTGSQRLYTPIVPPVNVGSPPPSLRLSPAGSMSERATTAYCAPGYLLLTLSRAVRHRFHSLAITLLYTIAHRHSIPDG